MAANHITRESFFGVETFEAKSARLPTTYVSHDVDTGQAQNLTEPFLSIIGVVTASPGYAVG